MSQMMIMLWVLLAAFGLASGTTLQVNIPELVVSGSVGTEFDVPVYVSILNGVANQGVARLYVQLVSSDSDGVIAPVEQLSGRCQTTWADAVSAFNLKLAATAVDYLDADNDKDAKDAALVDLGSVTDHNIGIDGPVLVFTQKWRFLRQVPPGTRFMLSVRFPATKSRYYNADGAHIVFADQVGVAGSITVKTWTSTDLSIVLMAMDSAPGDSNWNPEADHDGDGEITSTDLSIVLTNME